MKRVLWFGIGALVAAGCGGGESGADDAAVARDAFAAEDAGDVVVDASAVDAAAPVDAGPATRDECDRTGYPALDLEPVAASFDWLRPVFVAQPPGSTDLFVVERRGLIYIVRDDTVLETPFLDLREEIGVLSLGDNDERGLHSIAFHPNYATNGRFYVMYTPGDGMPVENRVASGHATGDAADGTPTTILAIPDFAWNHDGGLVTFGPDGYLYIGTGDGGGGGDPMRTAQNPTNLLGKMLRIDVDGAAPYAIPATNPFVGMAEVSPEIWALGYRNPWRYAFDRATDNLFVADVGQDSVEEIDVELAGEGGHNYGWSEFEGTRTFSAGRLRTGDTATMPVYEFAHSSSRELVRDACSISGGYVYRGEAIPELRGAYVFSDFCSTDVAALRYCDGEVRDAQRLDLRGGGIVSFGQDNAGELYVLQFANDGTGSVSRLVAR